MDNKDYNKIQVKNNMDVGKDVENESADQESTRPKLQGVVASAPKKVKKSLLSRLITGLLGPEGLSGIGGYVAEEVIKPAVRSILFDAINTGAHMAIFGDKGNPNRGRYYGGGQQHTSYNNAYNSRPTTVNREPARTTDPRSNVISRTTSRYGVEEYTIMDRNDAAHVITSLIECSDRYGSVSVADYYDLIKVPTTYTDNNYGWRHDAMVTARIVPDRRGGFVIKFPPVEVL